MKYPKYPIKEEYKRIKGDIGSWSGQNPKPRELYGKLSKAPNAKGVDQGHVLFPKTENIFFIVYETEILKVKCEDVALIVKGILKTGGDKKWLR